MLLPNQFKSISSLSATLLLTLLEGGLLLIGQQRLDLCVQFLSLGTHLLTIASLHLLLEIGVECSDLFRLLVGQAQLLFQVAHLFLNAHLLASASSLLCGDIPKTQ